MYIHKQSASRHSENAVQDLAKSLQALCKRCASTMQAVCKRVHFTCKLCSEHVCFCCVFQENRELILRSSALYIILIRGRAF